MKKITKYVAFDKTEFTSEQECIDYEALLSKKIYDDFSKIEHSSKSPIIYCNGHTDTIWFNIKSYTELKTLHDWAKLEFDSYDEFVKNIIDDKLIGHWICVSHNDYYLYLYGTLEEYKESAMNFTIN